MSEVLHICVGSDSRMAKAERVLEHSIAKHASCEFEIHWMRAGDPGWEVSGANAWKIGREPGRPYSGVGWATEFTGFRWAVPEYLGFTGRAVYFDVDMLVLGDVAELLEMPCEGWRSTKRPDVIVFNCEAWKGFMSIQTQKSAMRPAAEMRSLAMNLVHWQTLTPNWNNTGRLTDDTRLYHYTDMRTQPWRPYPEWFDYDRKAPRDEAAWELWHDTHDETLRPNK